MIYTVYPLDDFFLSVDFDSSEDAEEYAESLPCDYRILVTRSFIDG